MRLFSVFGHDDDVSFFEMGDKLMEVGEGEAATSKVATKVSFEEVLRIPIYTGRT